MNKVVCDCCNGAGCAKCCWKGWYTISPVAKEDNNEGYRHKKVKAGYVNPRNTCESKLTEIRRLHFGEGLNSTQIAKVIDVSQTTAHRWIRKWKLESLK